MIIVHCFFNSSQNVATINFSAGQLIVKLRSSSADEMYGELVHLVLRKTLEDHGDLAASDPCDKHAHAHTQREGVRAQRDRARMCARRERKNERERKKRGREGGREGDREGGGEGGREGGRVGWMDGGREREGELETRVQCFKNTIHEARHYMPEVLHSFTCRLDLFVKFTENKL